MSKVKKPADSPAAETQEEIQKRLLAHNNKSSKARGIIMGLTRYGILPILTIITWLLDKGQHGFHEALMYLLADNGLKSGRASGNVYMRNGVVRGFKVPALVQNASTAAQRAQLSASSSGWNSLTAAQVAAWNAATGFTNSDRFGRVHAVKGKALYIMLNQNLFNTAGTLITDPPAVLAVPGITSLTPAAAAGAATFTLTFSPTPTDALVKHLVFATGQLSSGTSKPGKSRYRLIQVIANSAATGTTIKVNYVAKWGTLVATKKVFIKLIPIQKTTGQAGSPIVGSCVIAA